MNWEFEYITVGSLRETLSDLAAKPGFSPTWKLVPNQVKNLAIRDDENKYIGYIELQEYCARGDRVHLFSEEDSNE